MRCPKCDSEMERVVHEEIEVDRCTLCFGLWFDALEKDDLVRLKGAKAIDIGSAARGKRYSDLRKVDCPNCHVPMLEMVDMQQDRIEYESCPTCFGTFFDAGEFRDLQEFTVLERFTSMLRILRD